MIEIKLSDIIDYGMNDVFSKAEESEWLEGKNRSKIVIICDTKDYMGYPVECNVRHRVLADT